MVQDMQPTVSSVTNTVFMEQRALNVQDAQHDNDMRMPISISREMPDDQWFAKQQLQKPILIETMAWGTSDTYDHRLFEDGFPDLLVGKESLLTRTLRMYAFYKMSPVFRLQVNATQFHQGQLMMCFDPFSQCTGSFAAVGNDYAPLFTRFHGSGLPNVKVMASESSPVELRIPYIHPRSYLTTNETDKLNRMGTLRVIVMNPLFAATGVSSTVNVSLWLYAEDAEVHVPMYYHETFTRNVGIMDTLSAGVKSFGNAVTGNVGQAISTGARSLMGAVSRKMDYPNTPVVAPVTLNPVENLAVTSGVSRSERLATNQVSGTLVDPSVAGAGADLDLLTIARTPMLFEQFTWQASDAPGHILYQIAVSPSFFTKIVAPGTIQPTFLNYIANAFVYWRGGIRIDLEFIATHFHSGKLLVGFVPNNEIGPIVGSLPTIDDVSTANPCVVVDLQQSSSMSFVVPFVSSTPYKLTTPEDAFTNIDENTMVGTLFIFVQNSLVNAANVTPTVEINMYARGAEDFEVAVPSDLDSSYNVHFATPPPFERHSDVKLQTNTVSDVDTPQVAVLATGAGMMAPREIYKEDFSLYSIVKRFSIASQIQFVDERNRTVTVKAARSRSAASTTIEPLGVSPTLTGISPEIGQFSKLGYFSALFAAWSGSIRYKFVTRATRTSDASLSVVHFPFDGNDYFINRATTTYIPQSLDNNISGLAGARTNLAQSNSLEVEVPFYTHYNMLLTYKPLCNNVTPLHMFSGVYMLDTDGTAEEVQYVLYKAAGEDFRLHYLRAPPTRQRLDPITG